MTSLMADVIPQCKVDAATTVVGPAFIATSQCTSFLKAVDGFLESLFSVFIGRWHWPHRISRPHHQSGRIQGSSSRHRIVRIEDTFGHQHPVMPITISMKIIDFRWSMIHSCCHFYAWGIHKFYGFVEIFFVNALWKSFIYDNNTGELSFYRSIFTTL